MSKLAADRLKKSIELGHTYIKVRMIPFLLPNIAPPHGVKNTPNKWAKVCWIEDQVMLIRYAHDFVIIRNDKSVVLAAKEILSPRLKAWRGASFREDTGGHDWNGLPPLSRTQHSPPCFQPRPRTEKDLSVGRIASRTDRGNSKDHKLIEGHCRSAT